MPTVQNTITDAAGQGVPNAVVTIRLYAGAGVAGVNATDETTLLDTWRWETDGDGQWSIDLDANADLTPANTYYVVTEATPNASTDYAIVVTASATPLWARDLIITPPDDLGDSSGFVDLTTAQTITGTKTITDLIVDGEPYIDLEARGVLPGASAAVNGAAINTALATGRPVLFRGDADGVTYMVDRTVTPIEPGQILTTGRVILKADAAGTYDSILNYPATDTGFDVLFDVRQLGRTTVGRIELDCNSVANLCGVGCSVPFGSGSDEGFTAPHYRWEHLQIWNVAATGWAVYFPDATTAHVGPAVGSQWDHVETHACVNGIHLGINECDDILIGEVRAVNVSGAGLRLGGVNHTFGAVYISPSGEDAIGVDVATNSQANRIAQLFVENTASDAIIPVRMNSGVNDVCSLSLGSLHVNAGDGVHYVHMLGYNDHLTIDSMPGVDYVSSKPNTSVIHMAYNPASTRRNHARINSYGGVWYAGFVDLPTTDPMDNRNNLSKIGVVFRDDHGVFHGGQHWQSLMRGDELVQDLAITAGGTFYLDASGTKGIRFTHTGAATGTITGKCANTTAATGGIFLVMNHPDSTQSITLASDDTATGSLFAADVTLAPGEAKQYLFDGSNYIAA